MPDTHPNTPNPSDANPSQDESAQAKIVQLEPALYELVGAARTAAILMEHVARDDDAAAPALDDALIWLSGTLMDATENVTAIHEGRAPRWLSTGEADAIRQSVMRAEARAAAREAFRATLRSVGE